MLLRYCPPCQASCLPSLVALLPPSLVRALGARVVMVVCPAPIADVTWLYRPEVEASGTSALRLLGDFGASDVLPLQMQTAPDVRFCAHSVSSFW